jgi:diguanylate cyclase (GGDEF)-like protein
MKRTIVAAVVLLALIPAILVGCAVNRYTQSTIRAETLNALTGGVHMMDIHMLRYFEHIIFDIKLKAEKEELKSVLREPETSAGQSEKVREKAENVLLQYVGLDVLGGAVIGADGKTVLSSRPEDEGLMMDKTELFTSIMDGKDSYSGVVLADEQTSLIEIAVPIFNDDGGIIGILKQDADPDLLYEYLNSLNLGRSGKSFLIYKDGYILYDKNHEMPAILYPEYQNNNSLEELVAGFKEGRFEKRNGTIRFETEGVKYIGAYEAIDRIGCIAVLAMEEDEMYGSFVKVKEAFCVTVLLLSAFIAASAALIGHLYVRPLKTINNTLKKIENGDLTARCYHKGMLEFEELGRNINSLADSYQKSERELRISSRIDSLTHLPNRDAIYELLDTLLYKHPNQALLLLDLEGFKNVNDNLGYDVGDRVLMEAGDILRRLPQRVCYPSRLGGAEFLVFITNWTAPRYPEKIAKRIIKEIEGIRFIDEFRVDIGATIGIEYADDERADKKKLIRNCNIAMHKAKLVGRNSYFVHYANMQKEI